MASTASVVYVLPDKIGGVLSYVDNLLAYRQPDRFDHHAILTSNAFAPGTPFAGQLSRCQQKRVRDSLPLENLYSVLHRLARSLPPGPGVLVANDWLELAMASAIDLERTVIDIVHGDWDYYYDLAVRHEKYIHAFVTYSRRIHARLRELLPNRRDTIFYLPYGVAIPSATRRPVAGDLRLLVVSRLTEAKGVFDLPAIDRHLRELGVAATWTIQGSGPDEALLRERWDGPPRVRWMGVQPAASILARYRSHDVLVFPCRSEGLPVALLEAMAAGVVPVVSDLESGIPDVVDHEQNGYRVAVGDAAGFAARLAELAGDRARLEAMSVAARRTVAERYDVRQRVPEYQALYARWRELYVPRPKGNGLQYGSRLDKPWLPNLLVRTARTAIKTFGRLTRRQTPAR